SAPPSQTAASQTAASQPPPSAGVSAAAESTAPSDAAYIGPEATITYSIWGDPSEIKSQQAVVDDFHVANPKITVKVTVSDWDTYWDKLQTGIAGGDAPDVFAMDGPLFPDYQSRNVLLDLKPYIDKSGYDLGQLADQAVGDFTTADGQFGLPRDLNVVALFYNKKMFDAASLPYPDDTWDWAKLVEVGKKLTIDSNGDGKTDQWGLYTETSDMENYWSSLVWQNGGDIVAPDGKSSLLGTDQAVGGIQFLQDLIWKDKIVPDPALFAETGDAFEQGKAAMEVNGSWLVATDLAAGLDFGIAPLPQGPAGRATSINPTGAVVFQGSKSPDAAWEFVKYLASPPAQTKLMELKASLPANKEVLAGPFGSSFDGAKVLADSIAYAHIKPSFKGYDEFATALQTELDANVFMEPKETARQAIDKVLSDLDAILAGG
ncbi:MAG: sugar ABC transporter substrate-binding protein, partial [Chloroflexi bacterium]|nr:sugar ABC transporter substrate-binding protein [Chloroflexota bacterium]